MPHPSKDGYLFSYNLSTFFNNDSEQKFGPLNSTLRINKPNGNKIIFESNRDGNKEVYIMNSDGSDQINISNHDSVDTDIKFSPDGLTVAWISNRDGNKEIYISDIFDSTSIINLTKNIGFDYFISFQPWLE